MSQELPFENLSILRDDWISLVSRRTKICRVSAFSSRKRNGIRTRMAGYFFGLSIILCTQMYVCICIYNYNVYIYIGTYVEVHRSQSFSWDFFNISLLKPIYRHDFLQDVFSRHGLGCGIKPFLIQGKLPTNRFHITNRHFKTNFGVPNSNMAHQPCHLPPTHSVLKFPFTLPCCFKKKYMGIVRASLQCPRE